MKALEEMSGYVDLDKKEAKKEDDALNSTMTGTFMPKVFSNNSMFDTAYDPKKPRMKPLEENLLQ